MNYELLGSTTVGDIVWAALLVVILANAWGMFGRPRWKVWVAHQDGLADLAQARNEQQVQVSEAQGRLDAAELNKQAAIIEAQAVSAQIKEIGDQLTKHDLYLRWQWIKMMEERNSEADTIYVPTEGNLPVLEAQRLRE